MSIIRQAALESVTREVRALVSKAGLPADDLGAHPGRLFLLGDPLQGVAAVEIHGEYGLLRSVVVDPSARGRGLGQRLVRAAEAACSTLAGLYLLTDTAETFFAAMGYAVVDRTSLPEPLQAASQVAGTVCSSATAMHKVLTHS